MKARDLKQRWRAGEPTAGIWMRFSDPTVAEILGDTGVDWILVDAEHAALDLQTLQTLIIALHSSPAVPLIRVPWNDFVYIKRVLDLGAEGVLVPHVSSAAEAQAAVAACKYPPLGNRGTGPRRPSRYGLQEREYLAAANDNTIALIMVETAAAVADIDNILGVPGLDGIIIGPVDLAASMGHLPDFDHPEVEAAIEHVISRAREVRVPFGSGRPVVADEWLARGAQLVAIGDDQLFLQEGARHALSTFRSVVTGTSGA